MTDILLERPKIPAGYKRIVDTFSSVILNHSYDKKTGYYFELMPGWESEGYDFIKETRLTDVKERFENVENVNQLSIYDILELDQVI